MSEKIKGLAIQNTPDWLLNLTKQEIEASEIPIKQLLDGSVYYPCCGLDGGVILDLEQHYQSFVYVDYGVKRESMLEDLARFEKGGYSLLGQRHLKEEEIAKKGFTYYAVPTKEELKRMEYYKSHMKTPFAVWSVFERQSDKDDSHGPKRFSLLYIGADGAAAYQALYNGYKTSPAVICIIQPGHGFGSNYSDFTEQGSVLHRAVIGNTFGYPKYLLYGGWVEDYDHPCWPGYSKELWKKRPYRADHTGEVRLWKRNTD